MSQHHIKYAFFGSDTFSTGVLDELERAGYVPDLIVTGPDKPVGRKQILTSPPVKLWAQDRGVRLLQPEKLRDVRDELESEPWDVFAVASYGKILPSWLIALPEHDTLNVHPSLLPKLRGASPIKEAILREDTTGVTIMQIDEEMDHGPIVAQRDVPFERWPEQIERVRPRLATEGGRLLAETFEPWVAGRITPQPQNHEQATYTAKVTREDGNITDADDATAYRKYLAYHDWPGVYFMSKRNDRRIRVKVTDAAWEGGTFVVKKVTPEGKNEMPYEDFLHGQH